MGAYLTESNGVIVVGLDGQGAKLEVEKEKLLDGGVFGAGNEISALRVWREKEEIKVLYLLGHDVAWPCDVYIFPLNFQGTAKITQVIPLFAYLAMNYGIPAIT